MVKVYYLMHSSFVVELSDRYLLFDYFDKGDLEGSIDYRGCLPDFDINKPIYVFASNGRKDHFTEKIFDIPNVKKYILSKDVKVKRGKVDKSMLQSVKALRKYDIDDMKLETLRSNDVGVAFSLTVKDINIYFAGTLNWWNAEGRGELYGEQYGREYRRYLKPILNRKYDIAFVPMDGRMGEDGYFLGMDYFIKHIDSDTIFPMNMWGEYQWISRFKTRPDTINLNDRIVDIDRENMIFEIED
ncbi:MBL fold metallo-hydrolase [Pseudobutyrivibrio ruminis]|uniref:MBL fold metallo-hydrolase n=1 Tax=Pseudobutyrivibrio ruminis TaxID=46206 RepID=UPI000408F596|nr:MBL fold metallo-hydrolase [Pseudobutyrivibrio ruminis]